MSRRRPHHETHVVSRIGWLREAVLGANDGLVSTASLIVGVAAASAQRQGILTAGLAGLVAGAMSMAAGEYVSVSSQADAEKAALATERDELAEDPASEHEELTQIYIHRGLEPELARQVAEQLMAKDALGAHARDELGISEIAKARPIQAGFASACCYSAGAAAPLIVAAVSPMGDLGIAVPAVALVGLAALGAVGARTGGASMGKATLRSTFWGALAMAITAGVGHLFGTFA